MLHSEITRSLSSQIQVFLVFAPI